MSKFLKRMGAKPMKYQFALVIDRLEMSLPVAGDMEIRWIRGPRTATSIVASGTNGLFVWDQEKQKHKPLMLLSTLYKDRLAFQKKMSKIIIKRKKKSKQGYKTVGSIDLDLAIYAAETPLSNTIRVKVGSCSDKSAFMKFTVHS
eukprot:g17142.t1